jgi:hypothetical protein
MLYKAMLIYSHTVSTRLQYICKFIFQEQLNMGFSLTIDSEGFSRHDGPKINYSNLEMQGAAYTLKNHALLFEKNIQDQTIDCFEVKDFKAFFKTSHSDFAFDIFAASFYLLSRYEEYLPHEKDIYGRYAHENSLAFKEGFLQLPLINRWIIEFAETLQKKFPSIHIKPAAFNFIPTYDIDMAWSYKSKGLLRNMGGFVKSPSMERLAVLAGLKKDPFDCYEFLRALHQQYQLDPVYFFLVAPSGSVYDKNISPYHHRMWQLIKRHAKIYRIGLHPSWKSNEKTALLKKEKKILETAGHTAITRSRQHYIKLSLPESFEHLLQAGITDDYSMGYGSINGFRASVAASFYWYNLQADAVTPLRLHPFCFMDANSFYEQKQNTATSLNELMHYLDVCKKLNGQLITIFHNNFLGTDKLYAGWRALYEKFTSQIRQ